MKIISDKVKPLEKKQIFILVGSFVGVLFLISIIIAICITVTAKDEERLELSPEEIVDQALTLQPIIDGNNKFPWSLRKLVQNDLSKVNFSSESSGQGNLPQTDLPRLRKGRIGAVFWSAYVDCSSQHKDAVVQTLEQIDVIQRLIQKYSTSLHLSTSAQDIEDAIGSEKIASIIALGGGHSIQSSLATLRQFHQLGVRVMQLTDDCNTPWASAAASDSTSGLTQFGHMVISEMNRLGMIVDLSRSSPTTAKEVIVASKAPVIFSSSGAYSLCAHPQNVPDEILDLVKEYKGVVMVGADVHKDSCGNRGASIQDIADHINYIRNVTSSENIGIGGGFDGNNKTAAATGSLDNPSRYPDLFGLLAETGGWSVEDLRKLAGGNILRVFKAVEQAKDIPQGPIQTWISFAEITNHNVSLNCMTTNYRNGTLFRMKG